VDTVYGRNLTRLRLVKTAYDPDNFFRRNNNITPAGEAAHNPRVSSLPGAASKPIDQGPQGAA
jgi:hypothetical protein